MGEDKGNEREDLCRGEFLLKRETTSQSDAMGEESTSRTNLLLLHPTDHLLRVRLFKLGMVKSHFLFKHCVMVAM
jgi:hypothetical protein